MVGDKILKFNGYLRFLSLLGSQSRVWSKQTEFKCYGQVSRKNETLCVMLVKGGNPILEESR